MKDKQAMPLTDEERRFLDAYVYEVTHEPFGGPATRDLRQRGVGYSDLNWILTAYQREVNAEGRGADGIANPNPPTSPWKTLEQVKKRSQEMQQEWEPIVRGQRAVPAR